MLQSVRICRVISCVIIGENVAVYRLFIDSQCAIYQVRLRVLIFINIFIIPERLQKNKKGQ